MEKEIEIVVDVETTGLDYTKERIIEFAGVRLEDGVIVDFGSGGTDVSGAADSETESLPLRGPLPFTRPRAVTVFKVYFLFLSLVSFNIANKLLE